MLIQGTFLAGITMLYTIWASDTFSQIVRIDEVSELCRMCSNTLAVLGSGNAPSKFCDALETLTNLTTKKLVAQLQQRANANANNGPLYTNDMYPSDLLSIDPTLYFSNMSWPEEFNFHNALMNPDSITEVFGELINWHG